jgi:hypothetical protein
MEIQTETLPIICIKEADAKAALLHDSTGDGTQ